MAIKSFIAKNGFAVGTTGVPVVDAAGTWTGNAIPTAKAGVPPGGLQDRVLTKRSNSDYDVEWAPLINFVDPPVSSTFPAVHPSMAFDSQYVYFTIADNQWLRVVGQEWTEESTATYYRPDGTSIIRRNDGSAFIRPD